MGDKILVIGSTSKVGSELVNRLVEKGEAVKAATRRPYEYRAAPGVDVAAFDYDERTAFGPALQDVDRVFMISKWTDDHPELRLNRFVDKAAVAGVRHVVMLTSRAVDPVSSGPIGLAEKHLVDSGVEFTILHPNWLMQNLSRGAMFPGIRDLGLVAAPAAGAAISFVDARDVAEVAAVALTAQGQGGNIHTLTGGQSLTHEQLAEILTEVLARPVVYQSPSEEAVRSLLEYHMWETENVDHILGLFKYVREGRSADVSPTLGALLGREPTTFVQFARDHAAVWK